MSHLKYSRVTGDNNDEAAGSQSPLGSSNTTAIHNILHSILNDLLPYLFDQYQLWLQFACNSPERKIIAIALLVTLGFGVLMSIKRIHAV